MAVSATVELNKYLIEKRKGIKALSEGISKVLSDSAEKGFVTPQGFVVAEVQDMIIASKRMLSDGNVAVVTEQIKLEIEIITKEYQLQIDQAKINWSIERGALLNDLAEEIAQLELSYDLEEEEINQAAIEIEKRKSVLLQAKTDLAVTIELLSKELAEIDALTVGYEVLLIRARIETNTEKLKIIPYLQQLITKEEELLKVQKEGMGSEQELIDAKKLLIQAKEDILPSLTDKANKRKDLGDAQYDQALVDITRAELLLEKIDNDTEKTDAAVKVGYRELVISRLQKQLNLLRNEIESKRLSNQVELTKTNTNIDDTIKSIKTQGETDLAYQEDITAGILREGDKSASGIQQEERTTVADIYTPAEIGVITDLAANSAVTIRTTAETSSKADVTSKLVHLIGSV